MDHDKRQANHDAVYLSTDGKGRLHVKTWDIFV